MCRSQALGHGSTEGGKLAAGTLPVLLGTPMVMLGHGEDRMSSGTDPGQQKTH